LVHWWIGELVNWARPASWPQSAPALAQVKRQAPDRGGFPGQPDVAEAVWPVGGDFEVDHRLVAVLDAGHFKTTQCDLARDGVHVGGDRHQVAQPVVDEPHSGNCSRKRRSFS
jgi:hypothetical protein